MTVSIQLQGTILKPIRIKRDVQMVENGIHTTRQLHGCKNPNNTEDPLIRK